MKTKQKDPTAWQRLEQVIKATNHCPNSFARYIGLRRGENLYQIKRGNNRISRNTAEHIHAKFPEFSVSWLMCGEEVAPPPVYNDSPVVKLPLYAGISPKELPPLGNSVGEIVISTNMAHGAEFAVRYHGKELDTPLRNSVLLASFNQGLIPPGTTCIVGTNAGNLVRIVKENPENPASVLLAVPYAPELEAIQMPYSDIKGVWLIVGAVCSF